ncbi:MAG: c-type cytochrome domain-containing protein [Bacteroidota bacterium]|nr:c-type cytochrome domain-containing protein [Bacteroidota bacterium]
MSWSRSGFPGGLSALTLFAALFFSACADQIVSECDVAKDAPAMRARFSDMQAQLFTPSCATAGCHGGSRPQAGLSLVDGASYAALVNIASTTNPGRLLVDPGNPEESVLILTLRRSLLPAMPPAGPLPTAVIDSVAAWIAAGAMQN